MSQCAGQDSCRRADKIVDADQHHALRALMGLGLFVRLRSGSSNPRLVRLGYGTTGPSLPSAPHRQGAQISPGRCANCRCTSAAFTVGCVPVGFAVMCQLGHRVPRPCMRFLSVASHLLHSGFLRTIPRGLALAFGSWLSLLTMSPSRYSHRGLAPHKFAPMLGAHPSIKRTCLSQAAYVKH